MEIHHVKYIGTVYIYIGKSSANGPSIISFDCYSSILASPQHWSSGAANSGTCGESHNPACSVWRIVWNQQVGTGPWGPGICSPGLLNVWITELLLCLRPWNKIAPTTVAQPNISGICCQDTSGQSTTAQMSMMSTFLAMTCWNMMTFCGCHILWMSLISLGFLHFFSAGSIRRNNILLQAPKLLRPLSSSASGWWWTPENLKGDPAKSAQIWSKKHVQCKGKRVLNILNTYMEFSERWGTPKSSKIGPF